MNTIKKTHLQDVSINQNIIIEKTYLENLLKFDKGDVVHYLFCAVILFYIWYISNINIKYLFPFFILALYIFYRQDLLHNLDLSIDHKLRNIINKILENNYFHINNPDILYFLDDIKIYKKYNPENFIDLLEILNKYYKTINIYNLDLVLQIFNRFIYSLPLELSKDFYLNINRLKKILNKSILSDKYTKIEMQSYIPYNYINNNDENIPLKKKWY